MKRWWAPILLAAALGCGGDGPAADEPIVTPEPGTAAPVPAPAGPAATPGGNPAQP